MTSAAEQDVDPASFHRLHIVQGEQCVSDDPSAVLSTLLGSCVAACMRDAGAGIGGMNHFLLPGRQSQAGAAGSLSHGVHAMELLVNALLAKGARRDRLEAKLFGGASLMDGLTDIGALNAAFAEDFLKREGIAHVGGSLGGRQGRRIQFWPVSGRARQVLLAVDNPDARLIDRRVAAIRPKDTGTLELF
jgi:chemotaxis protein CheD